MHKHLESTLHQTLATFGPSGFVSRPIALLLAIFALVVILVPIASAVRRRRAAAAVAVRTDA